MVRARNDHKGNPSQRAMVVARAVVAAC